MKKLILLSLLAILFACGKKEDVKFSQIEKSINDNAMGNDIKYTPIETTLVDSLNYNDYYDFVIKHSLNTESESIDENLKRLDFVVNSMKEENNIEAYHLWKFNYDRIKEYKNYSNKSETSVRIYKHKYSIINPMLNNTKVDVTNYYVFNSKDSLLGKVDDIEYKSFKKESIQHPKEYIYRAYFEAIQ